MNQKKTTVTLEDLLRIKRAERPPVEFWDQFDRELRLKQLAAIVEPRPWWASFIKVGARVTRFQVPIGAAAILTLSFVTVHEYRTPDYAAPDLVAPSSETAVAMGSTTEAMKSDASALAGSRAEYVASTPAKPVVPVSITNVGERAHSAPLPVQTARLNVEMTPSARAMAANLAAVQASDPRLMDDVLSGNVHVAEARQPVSDPLAQISPPGVSRRSRLLSTSLPVATVSTVSVGTSDRVARRLTDEQIYDRISRLDRDGNRLVIKF